MAEEQQITAAQVLQAIHSLTGQADSVFQAITDLADNTALLHGS